MGFLDWFGPRKQSTDGSNVVQLKKEANYEELLSKFQEVALESLNAIRYAIMHKDKKEATKLSEKFYLQYNRFTGYQEMFRKKGGKLYMTYQIMVRSIGPVYVKVNEYVNGTSLDTKFALREMEKAIGAIASIQPIIVASEQETDNAAVAK